LIEENRFFTIPDVSAGDIVAGDNTNVNYCNVLIMNDYGTPIISNASYESNYSNPIEITSGFFSAIECIAKEIKGKVLKLITFEDNSSINMVNIKHDGKDYKICVEPSRKAEWLLPNFIRKVIEKNLGVFSKTLDLQDATKEFYKQMNIDIHKGTVSAILYTQGDCWSDRDAAIISPSGYMVFRDCVSDDHRKMIEEYRKIISSLLDAGAKGSIQFADPRGIFCIEYTLQLYHIQIL